MSTRPLYVIAADIEATWFNKKGPAVNYAARPYLDALKTLNSIDDYYYQDSAREIVQRFLANAGAYRGAEAQRIKAELKDLLS